VILCNHVLEHIPDDTKAMQGIVSCFKTRRNGYFTNSQDSKPVTFADDTITDQKRTLKYLVSTTMYAFIEGYYLINYGSIGFTVIEEVICFTNVPELIVKKYCLAKGEIYSVCFK
jgi:hypothetical protein